jgi:hypothetical protein
MLIAALIRPGTFSISNCSEETRLKKGRLSVGLSD